MRYKRDLWSVYQYGEKIKLVYYTSGKISPDKTGKKRSKCTDSEKRFDESISRTRSTIFELAMCNDFEWFATLTLDAEKRCRNDLTAFRKDFAQMVRNENKKRSEGQKIEYLLIPEQHKNGAWHMHGLFKGLQKGIDLVENEHRYLDWQKYRQNFGFFSCSRIKSHEACSKYITKYVTKDIKKSTVLDSGAHSYYASQGLKRRTPLLTYCADRCPIAELPRGTDKYGQWDFENEHVKIRWLKRVDNAEKALLCLPDENGELTFYGM